VQLQAANGHCWQATYTTVKQHDATTFKGKGDSTTTTTTTTSTTTTLDPNAPASVEFTLDASVAVAGSVGPFAATVRNGAGVVMSPQPTVDTMIAPIGATAGPTPTLGAASVVTDATTLGSFSITGDVVGSSVSTMVFLTVLAPGTDSSTPSQSDDL